MKTPPTTESLERTLADWRVAPPRNPQFRAAVWARIGARRAGMTWGAYARQNGSAVAAALTVALLAGAWAGREQAQARTAAASARLAAAYVQDHDARAMVMPPR